MINLLKRINDEDLFGEELMEALFGNHPVEEVMINNAMRTDFEEDSEKYVLSVELPGFKKEDVKISLENGYLTIEAERKKENENKKYICKERRFGKLSRSYYLGENIDVENCNAFFKDGILLISVLKKNSKTEKIIKIE